MTERPTQAPSEVRLALTRVCLRSGSVLLPARARGALPADGRLEAYDPDGQEAWDLEIEAGRLHGLGPFLERHGLAVNDEVLLRARPDGHVVVSARPRARSASRDAHAVRRAVESLLAGGAPRTTDELREDHGLAHDAPLEAALGREPLLERRYGRWSLVGAGESGSPLGTSYGRSEYGRSEYGRSDASGGPTGPAGRGQSGRSQAGSDRTGSGRTGSNRTGRDPRGSDPGPHGPGPSGDAPSPTRGRGLDADAPGASDPSHDADLPTEGASPEALARARDLFASLGYRVASGGGGTLRLEARLGRTRTRILARVLDAGARPDWSALLQAVRGEGADRLALVGDVRDLTRLERPARGARATLWSWDGLRRVRDLAKTVPIGPTDLASCFDDAGLHAAGLVRFEARIEQRLEEQGTFAAVAERLAELRAPIVFTVDDLVTDAALSRESIVSELDRMAAPPLQWTERRGPGEFALRQNVADGLVRLETFARSLRERLPDPTRPRVRGADGPGQDELLGAEDLVASGPAAAGTATTGAEPDDGLSDDEGGSR